MQKRQRPASGHIETSSLHLEWSEAVWDTAIFGDPVAQITQLEVRKQDAERDFTTFEIERDALGCGLVSCRLSHEQLQESMLLEARGFRFIEMVYQPELGRLPAEEAHPDLSCLSVSLAAAEDLPSVLAIAGSAFGSERFHMDPRLDSALADQRYCNWVNSSVSHPTQRLYLLRDQQRIVAFFITESQTDGTCYWHLTAVAPDAQGQGYGRRAWLTMLHQARDQGATRVQTCIAARNHRVLNLYARLDFRFPPPLMTFHWVRSTA
ncbi:GNAT family N-acetyltransferase [Allochromatium vinosum]|uniref:GCN5-related N-acetyltransferase n=1 Tax=Allochromatium vinosum (strain ATCC 17899 / DSM 180 / NBRC 103801 / NCIMB 10441 / D) TaxID=572477 RepID=D3RU65_ALLVD|nr:GNAT family N-acetyltransferase [Allochromatium vinosum]ADC62724.1 GCN5-related N-acetyltransferase [Allochromatium vinosum DSM 180]